ncbi:hypothetical protein PHISCL_06287 [Aspergillus sclerotialis]|uniref:Uncharacterized protein n=1 Tax=Aspergillus sclerotialis TaxID=2070753 RepID=A0A3A2ZGI6_9EURO|nr:hypothetical protein PHISCL_06287 [Aspergillus sclerotialis]
MFSMPTRRQEITPNDYELTSTDNPEEALKDIRVHRLLRYYTTHLAAWYDLNDRQRHFTDVVPVKARQSPLLLSAVLAFSAASKHGSDAKENLMDIAAFYHLQSVQILIRITDNIQNLQTLDMVSRGEVLAAICLLRSYEIISRSYSLCWPEPSSYIWPERLTSQSHLQGCYSLLATTRIEPEPGLARAAFWNYVREDITVALMERRRLMIELCPEHVPQDLEYDDDYANYVTILLGQVINQCFDQHAGQLELSQWRSLHDRLETWRACLPSSFEPVASVNPKNSSLPFIWTLHAWHGMLTALDSTVLSPLTDKAAALQYYHTALIILLLAKPAPQPQTTVQNIGQISSLTQELDSHASEVCALAVTSESASVWINAFGPIAFCALWLRDKSKSAEVAKAVRCWGSRTGWPVSKIVDLLTGQ